MELQDSMATPVNFPLPMAGLWDRFESAADDLEDSFRSQDTMALPGTTAKPDALALADSPSEQKQASANDDLSASQSLIDYSQASDDQLLAAAKVSDGHAFDVLSNRYLRLIRKRVYSIIRNPEDTEDVVQDSLLKAYRHLPEFRGSCDFSTWLMKIAINTALMLLRKRKARPEVSFDHVGEADQKWNTWEIPDPSPNTERAYAMQEAVQFMSRAVKSLPPLYRSVLEQYHAQESSLREAADKLGITVNSAKSRLFRARRALRIRLEGQRVSMSDACY